MGDKFMSLILEKFYDDLKISRRSVQSLAIGISQEGEIIIEELDEMPLNHATVFNYIALKFGLSTVDTIFPIEAGENLARQGILALQIRNNICICYFPNHLESSQYKKLEVQLDYYPELCYQFKECTVIEGFVSKQSFLEYARSIILNNHTIDNTLFLKK